MSLLEHIVNRIRENEPRKPGETIDQYMKRTWKMALAEQEANKPVLPRVKAVQERSERLLERDKQKSLNLSESTSKQPEKEPNSDKNA